MTLPFVSRRETTTIDNRPQRQTASSVVVCRRQTMRHIQNDAHACDAITRLAARDDYHRQPLAAADGIQCSRLPPADDIGAQMTTDSQSPFRFNDDQPVTQWLRQLEAGDHEAARRLWKQYFDEVARLAGKRMGNASRRVIDEEDVALSVMRCLYEGAVRGHFTAPGEAATDKTASCGPSNVSTS